MGVFKWLRRERVTVETRTQQATNTEGNIQQAGTIRTEQYKRDLAEFQARRSLGNRDESVTPVKKKNGRHSLPVSCTKCTTELDATFNYEKKSSTKYKKSKRSNAIADPQFHEGVPNIQFLFQNQVFMPGDRIQRTPYTEPQKSKRYPRHKRSPELDLMVRKQIDFKQDEDKLDTTPLFYKNNSLPFDEKHFLEGTSSEEEANGGRASSGDDKTPSQNSFENNKDDSCEAKLWEVMSELKCFDKWADEQLKMQSPNVSTSEDNKSNTSAFGLPIASACNLDVTIDKTKMWNYGTWGVVPIQMKKMVGVTLQQVKMKENMEINILRKCRHPNILLLMGLYPDIENNVHLICEKCDYTLFGLLHVQGRKPSIQTSVHFALDIANALTFLRMHGYIHTELSSLRVMVTSRDTAKLADLTTCVAINNHNRSPMNKYDMYSPEPQYVNIEETKISTPESQAMLTQSSSDTYLSQDATKPYEEYRDSEHYRWHAPELFDPDGNGNVHPCSRSDVYSLCVILWECCNATVPWKSLCYEELKDCYMAKQFDNESSTGIKIPEDGTYPGCLLSILQNGLKLRRSERITLDNLQRTLQLVKNNLDCMEYIVLPDKLSKRKSKTNFNTVALDTTSPTSDSDYQTETIEHKAIVHKNESNSADSERSDSKKSDTQYDTIAYATKCYVSDDDTSPLTMIRPPEKEYSSACSTPITKIRARVKDIGTPGALHKSDSTEYCSIMSPEFRNFCMNETKNGSDERPATKLSRSFTPKSYRPLHIKVPDFNLDCLKSLPKDKNGAGRSSYSFDVSNYSLPTTPIARSNKLRKNAWLSGELTPTDRCENGKDRLIKAINHREKSAESSPEPQATSEKDAQLENDGKADDCKQVLHYEGQDESNKSSIENETAEGIRMRIGGFSQKREDQQPRSLPSERELLQEKVTSWRLKSNLENEKKQSAEEEDVLAKVNVKPLVAIHEKWIYEANRKTSRSMSLPEDTLKSTIPAVKPASHCVDTLQKSLPQLSLRRGGATRATHPIPSPPKDNRSGNNWEQYCQAREKIAKSMNIERYKTWTKREVSNEEQKPNELKVDQATDTRSIEEFIRGLVRKEFQHLVNDSSDNISPRKEEMLDKGVANIVHNLNKCEDDFEPKKETVKSFSRVKINGNNKPLLHITFNRSGENSLQVLDNCVNVTICDPNNSGREKNTQAEDSLSEEVHLNSLKRCQAFNAIQEARSTEDLYIDDDISTQMQENFGGKVKLIPLHGSLHEILCEKEDECCLIKVKQENGCDTIYFRCDNSDTESKDAVDGNQDMQDTVVFKRSISLVEERFQRVVPREKRPKFKKCKGETKPKSEVYLRNITEESRVLSNSSPSLVSSEPVEVNIESVLCYEDTSSSSDECLKCQNDEFELLERKIEEDLASAVPSLGCLGKISEENLSVINEDVDKDHVSSNDSGEIIDC